MAVALATNVTAQAEPIDPNRPQMQHEHTQQHEAMQNYTCPMHPEVITDHPGNCPKCGMKLVPLKEKKRGTSNIQRSTSKVGAMESPAVASHSLRDPNRPSHAHDHPS